MKNDKNIFQGHARLQEEREKIWGSQQKAADFFGISRVTWGQCERGNAAPSADVLVGLAAAGADVLYILTGQRSQPVAEQELLPIDERTMLDNYRHAPAAVRAGIKQTLGAFAPAPSAIARRKAA